MTAVVKEVQFGSEAIVNNRKAFNEIAHHIRDMVTQIDKITNASQRIDVEMKEALSAIENIAAISEESSAGAEELSATMEQQSASMQEMDAMANDLAKMSETLNLSLSKFKY